MKQRSSLDRDLVHAITSLPLDIERLAEILEAGADLNAIVVDAGRDLSVLHYACLYGRTQAVQLLLDRGAEINARDGSDASPLRVACEYGHTELVEALLERGTDVNTRDNFHGQTPLHWACICAWPETARFLLSHGADPSVPDHGGWTPLRHAMDLDGDSSCREEIIDLFRQYAPEQVMEAYCTRGPQL
ncbi:MAG: ankyrin repeat domain-containing protein [Syntrophorhabdaceae bacterium]|nr:ankyrin repeat domain-containing protein [Syntrophorhabdaceae bacterium]